LHVFRFALINAPKYVFQNHDIRGKSIVAKDLLAAKTIKTPVIKV